MKISFKNIDFLGKQHSYKIGKNTVVEHSDDNDVLIKRIEYDEFSRDVDSKTFDKRGNVLEHLHKDYYESENEEGIIETFKSSTQEYKRKSYTKIENGFKHFIDDFQSKSGKNYINDFVHDLSGNLIKIINNKKEFYIR